MTKRKRAYVLDMGRELEVSVQPDTKKLDGSDQGFFFTDAGDVGQTVEVVVLATCSLEMADTALGCVDSKIHVWHDRFSGLGSERKTVHVKRHTATVTGSGSSGHLGSGGGGGNRVAVVES